MHALWPCRAMQPGQPCGGERLLLMFDRWRKLGKAFYSEKRGVFDISKVGGHLPRTTPAAGTLQRQHGEVHLR